MREALEWILIFVGNAGIQDEAPERVSGLVNSAQGLDEERQGAVVGHHFDDALPDPSGELGTEGDLSGFVAFPTGKVERGPGMALNLRKF